MNVQERLDKFVKDIKTALRVARKPDKDEYFDFAKVTTLGIIVIGLIGFVIFLIAQLIHL